MAQVVRVAVVQDCPVPFNLAATIAKVEQLTAEAAEIGARLIVFPEAFISGYPKGLDFGARVGLRSPNGRETFQRYYESALELNSAECRRLGAAARKAAAYLVIGVIEKDGGTLYCTVLFYGPEGSLVGKHRKTMPTAMERLIWGVWRWLDAYRARHQHRAFGRCHLLGKLHAVVANGNVRKGYRNLLRAHCG